MFKWNKYYLLIAIVVAVICLLIILIVSSTVTKSTKKSNVNPKPTTADFQTANTNTNTDNTIGSNSQTNSLNQTGDNPLTNPYISPLPMPSITYSPDNKPIIKVGNEIIYQKDLETELKYYPRQDEAAKKLLADKIINDSKILQIAIDEGIIKQDNTQFNSPAKDYLKRVDTVKNLKTTIKENITGIKGVIISIWFLNDHVGPLGYDKAKEIAFAKISQLQNDVKSGKLTVRGAESQIRNDSSLAQLDPSYKYNASYDFSADKSKTITWEKEFDDILWQTGENSVTDIYLGKSFDFDHGGVKVPAYYMFGQISQKSKVITTSIDDYISEKGKKYEVSYF